jgi:hypothetical protein
MKRTFAATLAAAAIGGAMLVSTPAHAATPWVTLKVEPNVVYNGSAVAITGKCRNPFAHVVIKSSALGLWEKGKWGKKLTVELKVGWDVNPRTYFISAVCIGPFGIPGPWTVRSLTVKHAVPWTPIGPSKPKPPVPPIPDIPGLNPDVVIQTGFGGMAPLVADHHPVG